MNTLKLFCTLFILLLLDTTKPFGFDISVEFLFLGIIYSALNRDMRSVLILSAVFGYFKDVLLQRSYGLSVIEFPVICIMILFLLRYFLYASRRLHSHLINGVVVILAILFHIAFYSIFSEVYSFIFCIKFLFHSLIIWYIVNLLLNRWLKPRLIA